MKNCCTSNMNIKIHKNPFRQSWKFAVIKVLLYTQYEHVIIASFSAGLQVLRVLGCEDQNILIIKADGLESSLDFSIPVEYRMKLGFFFHRGNEEGRIFLGIFQFAQKIFSSNNFSRNLPICTETIHRCLVIEILIIPATLLVIPKN